MDTAYFRDLGKDAQGGANSVHTMLTLGGAVEIVGEGGSPVVVRTRKARALLAVLGSSNGSMTRSRLTDLLWPDRAEEQGRASLRQTLYELRNHLGDDAIIVTSERVALSTERITSDVAEAEAAAATDDVERLERRLGGMSPPFLDGLDGLSEELDDWLRVERPTLAARLVAAARGAAERALEGGRADPARRLADHALRLDPFDERSLRCAMRADAALGDQAQLHRRFRSFESALAQDLGARPAKETRALVEQLHGPTGRQAETPDAAPSVSPPSTACPAPARPWRTLAAGGLLLALMLIGGVALVRARHSPVAPTIAVVPFAALSSGSAYIASGIAEEVQARLAHEPGVQVLGQFTASRVRAGPDGLADARRLGVTHLLDGSVQRDGRRLRVMVEMTRVSDGAVTWSRRFDRDAGDLFAIQTDIAATVAERFSGRADGRPYRNPAPLPAVYDRYLAARALMRDRRAVSLAAADAALREAIARQPDYAPARALLAQVLMLEANHPVSYGTLPFERTRIEARAQAERAARLDPELGEAQAALGLLTYSNAASLPYYRRAVALDPQRAEFHRWLAQALMATGQGDAALAEFRRAVAIDPLWGLSYEHLIVALDRMGRVAEVGPVVRRFLSLSGDERARTQLLLAEAGDGGALADGLRLARRLFGLAPGDRVAAFRYASALAALGEIGPAHAVLTRDDWVGQFVLAGRSAALAAAVRTHPALYWDIGSDFWGSNDALVASGQGPALLAAFDARFGDVRRFRAGEMIDPPEAAALVVAMRGAGRTADARVLTDRLAAQLRMEAAQRQAPDMVLADRAVLSALTGDPDGAIRALDRISRTAPQLLLGVPERPLGRTAAFRSLAGDPRLATIDRRLRGVVNGERRKLGWPPL